MIVGLLRLISYSGKSGWAGIRFEELDGFFESVMGQGENEQGQRGNEN